MIIQSGNFRQIYDPSHGEKEPWYINDHCFIQDEGGLWHMFGITHQEPADPLNEKFFAHATSDRLLAPQWQKQRHVLHADYETFGETHVWAPQIIWHQGLYWMYYCAGGDDHSRYIIHLATSPDLWTWQKHESNPMVVDGFDARDPMILRYEGGWIMYYTATSSPQGGHHVVNAVTSQDLVHWGDKREVFRHPETGTYGGPTESPFVVRRGDLFYLFVCNNTPYNHSEAFESADPFHWDIADKVGDFDAHAAEVILLENGKSYISRAGWGEGGLYLAELQFTDVPSSPEI
jgi:arabinan endo-1,5-alpha-L-arabinosidase